ncbi:hypothetical protein BST61_g8251 [Cercospora zeina]
MVGYISVIHKAEPKTAFSYSPYQAVFVSRSRSPQIAKGSNHDRVNLQYNTVGHYCMQSFHQRKSEKKGTIAQLANDQRVNHVRGLIASPDFRL